MIAHPKETIWNQQWTRLEEKGLFRKSEARGSCGERGLLLQAGVHEGLVRKASWKEDRGHEDKMSIWREGWVEGDREVEGQRGLALWR